jgi:single-stranded DNA-binding protein
MLPPVGNKAPTTLTFHVYGKACDKFKEFNKGNRVYIHGAKLRFDLESKAYSLHGGVIAQVTEAFPVLNDVILTGRCIKDIDQQDARAFKTTADGLMIANQTISVNTGRNQADLFNFYAINTAQDKLNQAELLVNFTRKGTGITIRGRLVTDAWTDKESQQRRSITKIQLVQMTLAPKKKQWILGSRPQVVACLISLVSTATHLTLTTANLHSDPCLFNLISKTKIFFP